MQGLKKIKSYLLIFFLLASVFVVFTHNVSAATEDLTTYTEVDPDNRFTETATRCTVTNADRDEVDYVYKDYGADYFGSSWEHRFTVRITSTTTGGVVFLYAQANALGTISDLPNNIGVLFVVEPATTLSIILRDRGVTTDTYTNAAHDGSKIYYMTLIRSGATLTLSIYNDTGRTDLADTLSIAMVEINYRYLYTGNTDKNGGSGYAMSGYIENLELMALNLTTNETTGIGLTNATARGFVNSSLGFSGNYNYGFYVGTTSPVNESNAIQNVTGAGTVAAGNNFSYNVSSLSKGTHYYVRAWATNATFFGTGNEVDFYTKCDAPTGLTAVSTDCSVNLAWTKGAGADKTTIRRKSSSYPTSPTDGTVVYNGTSSSYSDSNGGHQYYRAWSWAGDKHSDGNASVNITVPICPPTSVTGEILINNTLNISWTKGAGANTTVVVRKSDSSPTSITDGTVIYNATGTHVIESDLTSNYYFRLWSYANGTYSTSVALAYGALVIRCYDEETNDSLYFDVFISNEDGSETYESKNNTNPLIINIADLPIATTTSIRVSSASNYSAKSETFTGYSLTSQNSTATYVILLQEPKSKGTTNVTCINTSSDHHSYPAFTLSADVITILADAADEFNKIIVNYTHDKYNPRIYYRDLTTNHIFILNAYLSSETSALYNLRVIETIETEYIQTDKGVEGAYVVIKRYSDIVGNFVGVSSLYTDANGYINLYLIPDVQYKIFITKDGYEDTISDYIPTPANEWGQTAEKWFRIIKISEEYEKLIFDNMTITIEPIVFDWYKNFTIYFNITSSDSLLEWFTINVLYTNDSISNWIYVYNITNTNPSGGHESYLTNKSYGRYGFVITIKKENFSAVKIGSKHSDYKYVYTLWPTSSNGSLDTLMTNAVGKSPVYVGNKYATWTACIAGVVATFVLFTFSPRLAGLGVLGTGITLGAMKMPFNIIGNAMTWAQIALIIIIGLILMITLKKKT